jgi:hypothetical protein
MCVFGEGCVGGCDCMCVYVCVCACTCLCVRLYLCSHVCVGAFVGLGVWVDACNKLGIHVYTYFLSYSNIQV